jgi:hypothetical protein
MSPLRRLAAGLLRVVLRHSSGDTEDWVKAMLRELDFIEDDWAALFWAMGSTTAIFRCSARRRWLEDRQGRKEAGMNQRSRNVWGVVAGVGIGLGVAVIVIALRMLSLQYFPSLEAGRVPWRLWLLVMALPEAIFIVSAIALWRKRKPMAIGILLTAAAAATHFAIHIASHWRG